MADEEKVERTAEEDALHKAHVEEMKKLGIETPEPEKEPESPKPAEGELPAPQEKKPEGEPAKPEQPADKKPQEPGRGEPGGDKQPERPLKYIPIPQYQAEKAKHEEALASRDATIAQLQAKLAERAGSQGTEEEKGVIEDEVRALADEIGIEAEKAQKLIDVARKGIKVPELPKAQQEALATIAAQEQERREAELFNKQWEALVPDLQKAYPNATATQIAEAKAEMDKISHSQGYEKYPLDYALFKNQDAFNAILTNPKKRSAESGALGKNAPGQPKERVKPDMATMTPEKLRQWELQNAEDLDEASVERPLVVQRNGKAVRV